jgi:hypothetical protein
MLHGTARGEIQWLTARRIAGFWLGYDHQPNAGLVIMP